MVIVSLSLDCLARVRISARGGVSPCTVRSEGRLICTVMQYCTSIKTCNVIKSRPWWAVQFLKSV